MDQITPSTETALQESPSFSSETFEKLNYILKPEQIDVLKKMRVNLELHRETTQIFRSEVEMRFSVLNDTKFPTADAKYWQAVREQDVHFSNLVTLMYEFETEVIKIKNLHDTIRKHQISQKKLEQVMAQIDDELDMEEAKIKHDMLQNKIDALQVEIQKSQYFQDERQRVADNRWREVVTWEMICAELQPQMKYGILSYEHHQPESYGIRMERQERIMVNSGAKGSPSEAINISSQNSMIHKLIQDGTLKPDPRELPIDRATRKVVGMIESDNNYINQPTPLLEESKVVRIPQRVLQEQEVNNIFSNNPQVPKE